MRRALVLCSLAACTVEGGKDVPVIAGEAPVTVDPTTQKVAIDVTKVPVLPTCGPGQVVRRDAAGTNWECAPIAWVEVKDKPLTFTPAPHTSSLVTDFDARTLSLLASTPVTGTFRVNGTVSADAVVTSGGVSAAGVSIAGPLQLPGAQMDVDASTGALRIAVGDQERMRIDADGTMRVGTDASTADLVVTGRILGAGASQMWNAVRTGYVGYATNGMATIPGLSLSINLPRRATVQMLATGEARATNTGSTTSCHIGLGFRIDGSLVGDSTYGQRIQMLYPPTTWWSTWSLSHAQTMNAGAHTIDVQADDTQGLCNICAESGGQVTYGYTACNLHVIAIYE